MARKIQDIAVNTNQVVLASEKAAGAAKEGGQAVGKAVLQMANIEKVVTESSQAVTKLAGKAFHEIIVLVDQVTNQIQRISASVQQIASGSQQLVKGMVDIAGVKGNCF